MDRLNQPVTSWDSKNTKITENNDIDALLGKCIENNAESSQEQSIVEPPKDDGQYVSIRCRRHKKRFNVPVLWLRTCEWLCPKCYDKLSPTEREKYAPRGAEKPEIRSIDVSRPTIRIVVEKPKLEVPREIESPSKDTYAYKQKKEEKTKTLSIAEKAALMASRLPAYLTKKEIKSSDIEMDCIYCGAKTIVPKSYYYAEHFFCPTCSKHLYDGEKRRFKKSFMGIHIRRYNEIEEKFLSLVREESIKGKRCTPCEDADAQVQSFDLEEALRAVPNTKLGISSAMSTLLPKYRIACKKCGQIVPCHREWFKNSMVLCPTCFNNMPKEEILRFHRQYPEDIARVFKIDKNPKSDKTSKPTKRSVDIAIPTTRFDAPTRWTAVDSVCSSEFIMRASCKELAEAVKSGRLSKVRARIELNRRKNAEYYNDLPDADVAIVPM